MSSLFDPVEAQNLLDEALEENATRREPLPVAETVAQIVEQKISGGVSGPHTKNPGKPWTRIDFKLEISDPDYLSLMPSPAPEKVTTFLGIMVDMDNGKIATGPNRNIRLGKLRQAAGCNGRPLSALNGQFIRITIGHKPHPTEVDDEGNPIILDEVTGYTKV